MLDQVLSIFRIRPDVDLDLMRQDQSLSELAARVLTTMDATLARDSSPTCCWCRATPPRCSRRRSPPSICGMPVGHVEAGLRSHDLRNPFPEEMNRRLTSVLTAMHLAPTPLARRRTAARETMPADASSSPATPSSMRCISCCANRFDVDATPLAGLPLDGHRLLVVTSHRREVVGAGPGEHLPRAARPGRALSRPAGRLPGPSQSERPQDGDGACWATPGAST